MIERLLALNENSHAQIKMIDELKCMLLDRDALIEILQQENTALKEQKKLSAQKRLGSPPEAFVQAP